MKIYLADNSVNAPSINNKNFNFIKKHIGIANSEHMITMERWIENMEEDNSDLLLQMDIEGNEYLSILSMPQKLLNRFRIISIEFHDLQNIWGKDFYSTAKSTFEKLLENHVCVHLHPNNCCGALNIKGIEIPRVCEFTFIRKDRVKILGNVTTPNQLDSDNRGNPTLTLSDIWYKD
ncbi:methyltransferase [Cytophagaceae bacterium SJW1-29]|uniref:Methyltransferase n=2 Tax=Salmonirosea aquatica TaxID=2654236 RepID=A0A7C9BC59_9BACT|nr:methyltransferase [Cytophagaceae bacterium SJW1-29]